MSVELPIPVEQQLRELALAQGREVQSLVEEAVRLYLEAAAITDVDAAAVADAQLALVSELPDADEWKA